ncbi:MAG: FkbM family methyltransferase [Acidimicrobiales bacterium]
MKTSVARALCTEAMGRALARLLHDQLPFRGLRIDTSAPVFSHRVKAQLFWRIYESAECRFVQRYLVGAQCAIELGSSLGVVSSHLANVMGVGGRLVCVEANPALIPTVKAALARFQTGKGLDVRVLHAAIGAEGTCREATLLVGDETVGSRVVGAPPASRRSVSVPALRLSEAVQRSAFGEYVLVSDIEGAEASFILSDRGALRSCRRMVIELHDVSCDGRQVGYGELLEALMARGFRLVDRRGPVVVLDQAAF